MSDAEAARLCATGEARFTINRELFNAACAAKGATDTAGQARLFDRSRKQIWQYATGQVEPRLSTARKIADLLEVDIDDLWPRTTKAAA